MFDSVIIISQVQHNPHFRTIKTNQFEDIEIFGLKLIARPRARSITFKNPVLRKPEYLVENNTEWGDVVSDNSTIFCDTFQSRYKNTTQNRFKCSRVAVP